MKFIVLQNQGQFGSFDLNQLQAIVNEGHFQLTDYCWAEQWSEWRLLGTLVSRIPPALRGLMPDRADEKTDEPFYGPDIKEDASQNQPSLSEQASCPAVITNNSTLKAGMVVKNESQSASCDFITSLALRGIYVKNRTKSEDAIFESPASSETSLHVARGEEIIGCYLFKIFSNIWNQALYFQQICFGMRRRAVGWPWWK